MSFSQYHLHCSTLSNKVCRARSFWVTAGSYEEISAIANGEGRNYIEKMLSRLRCRQKEEESVAVELVSSFSGWPGWFVFWNRPTPTHFSQLWTDTGPLGASEGARGGCVLFPLSLHGHIEHPLRTAWPRSGHCQPGKSFLDWTRWGAALAMRDVSLVVLLLQFTCATGHWFVHQKSCPKAQTLRCGSVKKSLGDLSSLCTNYRFFLFWMAYSVVAVPLWHHFLKRPSCAAA